MTKRSVNEILAEAMPDMEIVNSEQRSTTDSAPSSRAGHSVDELRRKYLAEESAESLANSAMDSLRRKFLGHDASQDDVSISALPDSEDADDVEVVQVRPKVGSADPAVPSAPKTVIVSKTRGIIGRQG